MLKYGKQELLQIINEEALQLGLPGIEAAPTDACEPATGVENLTNQLAQMVVDSPLELGEYGEVMELLYDKIAERIPELGVSGEEDDYQRTTMGFMESLRKMVLYEIDRGPTGTEAIEIETDPEVDPESTIKTAPVHDIYTESQRLFDHFFGKYDADALEMILTDPTSKVLKAIVLQLFGWAMPRHKRYHDEPGSATVKIAQDFEEEGKDIEGNEDEFVDRLEAHENAKTKEQFDANIAQREPARNVKASPAHIQKALGQWAQWAQEQGRSGSGSVPKTLKLQEILNSLLEQRPTPAAIKQAASQSAEQEEQARIGAMNTGDSAGASADKISTDAEQQVAAGGAKSVYTSGGAVSAEEPMGRKDDKDESVSKKIGYLMRNEKMPQDQAVAVALSMEKRGELGEDNMKINKANLRSIILQEVEALMKEDEKWIQGAEKDIERRGTEGVCTGEKFGSESCPPDSKRYNLAKTFRKMAKKRKKKE